jgi:tetratricopeptide (TPR) repeat protein
MKKKYITLFLFIALCNELYGGIPSFMPMPSQYKNFDQYQQALQIWEKVHKKIVARNAFIQLPPMPMPHQYHNLDQYQRALTVWERMGTYQGRNNSYAAGGEIVNLPPMPIPYRYKKYEHYQQALQAWINVSKNIVARHIYVQPPAMPMPIQYRRLENYQNALQAWETVFE